MKKLLDENQNMQDYLYTRGFLITNDPNINEDSYPFYNNWVCERIEGIYFYIHNKQKIYIRELQSGSIAFLIGHAYNPIADLYDEQEILEYVYSKNIYERVSELTGIFVIGVVTDDSVKFIGDAACMQSVFYGTVNGFVYISSHSYLLKDITGVSDDPFIRELTSYKYYRLFGRMLPGDRTAYCEFRRVEPNFEYEYKEDRCFIKKRFYPLKKIEIVQNEDEYNKIIDKCYEIMKSNMTLIPKKWGRPAISLTGGCDSKTTLSCVEDYSKYSYFSYISTGKEEPDAIAAHQIAEMLGIEHTIYNIPQNDSDFADIDVVKKILEQNGGNIGENNVNDIRKRAFFANHNDFDVEVKSWASEIARAYYNKRFHKKRMPHKVTPRMMTAMYKVIVNNRKLAKSIDNIFSEYLQDYYNDNSVENMDWYDLIFWEYRVAAWNGLVISGEHNFSYDLTIPYNNRVLLDLLLRTPLKKRINDIPHKDIQHRGNELIANSDISVQNVEHTKLRAVLEGIYFNICSRIIV